MGGNLYGQVLQVLRAPPDKTRSQIFKDFLLGGKSWRVGVVNVAVLACVLWTTSKKVVNF